MKRVRDQKSDLFIGAVFVIFLFFSVVPGIGSNIAPDPVKQVSKIDQIREKGKLIVGTSADYPPYEFRLLGDKEGEIVGLDIDIAREIAKALGVELEVKNIVFHRLFTTLNSGEVDLVIAGLAPSERRKEIVDFSDIYYQAIQNLVIHTDDAEKITSLTDLRGMTVGVQKDSIQADMARKQILGAQFLEMDTITDLIDNLKARKINAIILEKPVAESYVFRNKDLVNIDCSPSRGAFDTLLGSAIAVKKGDSGLLREVNRILTLLKQENKIKEFVEDAKILMNK